MSDLTSRGWVSFETVQFHEVNCQLNLKSKTASTGSIVHVFLFDKFKRS